jgi:hypothetical protein
MALRPAFSVALTLLAATCSEQPAAFYNPKNGVITQCEGSDLDPLGDECIATYQRAGWEKFTAPVIRRETPPRITQ